MFTYQPIYITSFISRITKNMSIIVALETNSVIATRVIKVELRDLEHFVNICKDVQAEYKLLGRRIYLTYR